MALDLGLRIMQLLDSIGIKPGSFLGTASNVRKAFTGGKPTFFKPHALETLRSQNGTFTDALNLIEEEAKYIANATDAEKMAFLNNLMEYKSFGGPQKTKSGITALDEAKNLTDEAGDLQTSVDDLMTTAKSMKDEAEANKNKALKDLDDFFTTGGQPFKAKDNKFLGGSMHEEGQLRTGIRQFLQSEFKNGRLKLNDLDKERVMQYSPMTEHDPILVFKKIYGNEAYNKAGSFPGAFEKGESFSHYEKIFRENMGEDLLKVKDKKYVGDGRLVLTESEDITPKEYDDDIPFAEGGIAGIRPGYLKGKIVKKIDEIIAMIVKKEPIEAMKEVNKVIGKKGKYKNLSKEDIDKIVEGTDDWIMQRDPDDLYVYDDGTTVWDEDLTKEQLIEREGRKYDQENIEGTPPPGSRGGKDDIASPVQSADESLKDMIESELTNLEGIGATKMAERARLKLKYPGITEDLLNKILIDDNPQRKAEVLATIDEAFKMMEKGKGTEEIIETFKNTTRTKQATGGRAGFANGLHAEKPKINLEKLRRRSLIHNDQPLYIDRSKLRDLLEALDGGSGIFPGYDVKNDLPKEMEAAQGGIAKFYTGGMVDVEPDLSDIGHGSDALMARTRLMSPGSQATTSTGLNYLLAEDNDNIRVPFKDGFKVYPKIKANKRNINLGDGKNVDLQDLTYGGTLMYDKGPFSGGIEYLKGKDKFDFKDKDLTLDKDTTDREIANLILMMKLKNGSIKFKGNKDDQMINFSKSFADGGRIGFSGGGMGRRAFLKLMAALTGGVAAAKTGILGLGEGAGKKAVGETVKKAAGSSEVPPYFFKLVDKIKTMGDETLASQDKAIAKKYKDYVMEEDFAGNITIIKKNMDTPYPEEVVMSYKVDDVSLPSGKGMAKVDEYEEFTVRPDGDGKMKDIEPGVPDEVVNEGSVFEDNMTEFGITKKAAGGRIGFSGGKLAKYLADKTITGSSQRFLEKVFGKQGLKEIIEGDPDMHRGLLEVVEMFRKKDKEGLKMYMQKFLPHMDDATVEDFIIGSGGTEGIEGQLIRLGSGRDYAGKIEMMKKADNMRKLDNLDVTEEMIRKPNASGGIQTMLGE